MSLIHKLIDAVRRRLPMFITEHATTASLAGTRLNPPEGDKWRLDASTVVQGGMGTIVVATWSRSIRKPKT